MLGDGVRVGPCSYARAQRVTTGSATRDVATAGSTPVTSSLQMNVCLETYSSVDSTNPPDRGDPASEAARSFDTARRRRRFRGLFDTRQIDTSHTTARARGGGSPEPGDVEEHLGS
eukprot:224673-Prymnesium_polylepis.1